MFDDETVVAQRNGYRPSRRNRSRSPYYVSDADSLNLHTSSYRRSSRHRSRSRTRPQEPPVITDEEYANLRPYSEFRNSRRRRSRSRRSHRSPSPPPASESPSRSPSPTSSHADRRAFCEHCRRNSSRGRASSRERKRDDKKRRNTRKSKHRSESAHRSRSVQQQQPNSRLSRHVTMWELDSRGTPKKSQVDMPDSCLNGSTHAHSSLEPRRRVRFADFADLYYF